ncbi:MAG: hypothetical protein M0T80_06330 [Actinomycetota bacterium]|nr:hypothetical protein [Actinomycetota bacterium]
MSRAPDLSLPPSPEELAAIVAAVVACWPGSAGEPARPVPTSARWRFSGRWWSRPSISRRDRPWVGPQG